MKRLFLFFWMLAAAVAGQAQDMAAVFTAMPDEKIPQLEHAWRKDLVDLYQAGKEARLKNTMNGYSVLQQLTPDYLLLRTTGQSTVEMKMLPLINNTYVVCVVTTVDGPVSDSRVAFYTTAWEPLAAVDLFTPVAAEWFIKKDIDKNNPAFRDAVSRLDMELIRYNLHPDQNTLTATYTTPEYLSREDREKTLPFLKKVPKIYTWEKSRFQ